MRAAYDLSTEDHTYTRSRILNECERIAGEGEALKEENFWEGRRTSILQTGGERWGRQKWKIPTAGIVEKGGGKRSPGGGGWALGGEGGSYACCDFGLGQKRVSQSL